MLSSCPNCLTQVEHPDSEMRVSCPSCQESFSPFLTAGDAEGNDFAESTAAFKEIIDFGESTYGGKAPEKSESAPVNAEPSLSKNPVPVASPVAANDGSFLLAASPVIPGNRISQVFPPISAWADLDAENPLAAGMQSLQLLAQGLGANALIDFRFSPLADGSRAVFFAVPAICQPE